MTPTLELIFESLDEVMRGEELYLDPDITLPDLSRRLSTNRTYVSRAVCAKFKNFRDYVNTLRVERLLEDMQEGRCGKIQQAEGDEFALRYGFRSRRSLDRILALETGCTYLTLIRRRGLQGKNAAYELHEQVPV